MKADEIEVQRARLIEAERLQRHIRLTREMIRALGHKEVRIALIVKVPDIGSAIKALGASMSTEKSDGHPHDFRGMADENLMREIASRALQAELKRWEGLLDAL